MQEALNLRLFDILNGVVVNVKSLQPGGTKFGSCYGPSTSRCPFVFFFVLFSYLFCCFFFNIYLNK